MGANFSRPDLVRIAETTLPVLTRLPFTNSCLLAGHLMCDCDKISAQHCGHMLLWYLRVLSSVQPGSVDCYMSELLPIKTESCLRTAASDVSPMSLLCNTVVRPVYIGQ